MTEDKTSQAISDRKKSRRTHTGKETLSLKDFVRGTDENNLAEFPLALLTDVVPLNQKTMEFQDTVKDWTTGQKITRRVCVTGSDKFGLPTAKDDEVLAALVQLTGIVNDFTSPEVPFTKHQIIELLRWENSGWAYDRIEESLHRWKGVSVHYWMAWRDHESGRWTDSEASGVIDYVKISDGRRIKGTDSRTSPSRFVWNRQYFKSFAAKYLKPLDFGFYCSLKRPAAKRAYRFLDKRFFHQPDWEFDLHSFACEKLGFSRKYDTGQLKARLQPAMTELEQAGFIKPVSYRKVRPKTWSVLVSKVIAAQNEVVSEAAATPMPIVEKLVARGVANTTAEQLVGEFRPELIEEKIQYVDWLVSRTDKRTPSNVAGFLVAAIRNDYPLPKDFSKTRERKSKRQPIISVKPISEMPLDTSVQDYLAKQSPIERENLEAAAVNTADAITAEGYHRSRESGGLAFKAYQAMVIERYVRRLICKGGELNKETSTFADQRQDDGPQANPATRHSLKASANAQSCDGSSRN